MKSDEILESYIESLTTNKDNLIKAAAGKLIADRSKELTGAILLLKDQLPITISELSRTISKNTQEIIESNKRLSKSNESYAKWMKWLTLGLFVAGIAQVIVSIINIYL